MSDVPNSDSASSRSAYQMPRELRLTSGDFRKIAAMVHADAGIYLAESKLALVHARLAKRLRALGLESFQDYCALVATSEGLDERQKMLAALTTNVTRFYREPHHFEHLETHVLPPLLDAARRGGRVRIWSAACSNGQEPYSIALTVLNLMPDAGHYDVKILATDIDTNMIGEGQRGIYTEATIRPVPAELRARWFVPVRNGDLARDHADRLFRVDDKLRGLVGFRELNLMGRWPMKGRFQAIFCRNVAIYFEQETQRSLWDRLAPLLAPGGILYLGHSERLAGPAADRFESVGITTYKLRPEARP